MKRLSLFIVPAIALALIAGCDKDDKKPAANNAGGAATDPLPSGLIVTAAPAGAKSVVDVKKDAARGAEIIVTGVIAGSMQPVADNRAVFTLGDATLKTCDKIPGDACKTPWDACCEDPKEVAARTLLVQVVDQDGRPLKANLKTAGLAPMKQVTAKGVVRSVSGEGEKRIVTIDATVIHIKG